VPSDLSTPTTYARQLLELCEDALALTAAGAPTLSYLSTAVPAFDCNQLTVEIISLGDAPFASTSTFATGGKITAAINLIGFRVVVVRCVASIDESGAPPTVAEIEADADKMHQDVFAIWTRVRTAQHDEELFGGACSHLIYDGAIALETEGGMAAWQIDFRAEIEGFANSGT